MQSDPKVYRAASMMLKIYGLDAGYHAAQEIEASHDKGDLTTSAAWEQVYVAVEDFLSPEVPPESTVH